jgi:hypothetical protein
MGSDSHVRLEFVIRDIPRTHDIGYVDLWMGEAWVAEILPDGSLKAD